MSNKNKPILNREKVKSSLDHTLSPEERAELALQEMAEGRTPVDPGAPASTSSPGGSSFTERTPFADFGPEDDDEDVEAPPEFDGQNIPDMGPIPGAEPKYRDVAEEPMAKLDIPSLKALYPDCEFLKFDLPADYTEAQLDHKDIQRERVKRIVEPEDVYDPKLNPELYNIVVMFLRGFEPWKIPNEFGQQSWQDEISGARRPLADHYIRQINKIANGRNQKPVTMLRERLFRILYEGKLNAAGVRSIRTPAHDRDNLPENRLCIRLLEYSVFDLMQSEARRHNTSVRQLFVWAIKNAIDNETL